MNKFRAWLIRKLGGYVYLSEIEAKAHLSNVRIIRETLPCITLNFDSVLPPPEWGKVISESEKIKLANLEAAEKIGRYIIDNGLYEIGRYYDVEFNRERVRYKIRVVQPPNAPQLSNEYGIVDEVHNDN